jgi:retron-type reverse transcriptase
MSPVYLHVLGKSCVKQYWRIFKAQRLACEYHPQGVRAVEIPKPKGGTRQLGIPCVVARLIQQALLQQLTPILMRLGLDKGRACTSASKG